MLLLNNILCLSVSFNLVVTECFVSLHFHAFDNGLLLILYITNGMHPCSRTVRLNHRPPSVTRSNRSSSIASVGNNNGSSEPAEQTKRARAPRTKTQAGDRLEEIDRPLIVPEGMLVLSISNGLVLGGAVFVC